MWTRLLLLLPLTFLPAACEKPSDGVPHQGTHATGGSGDQTGRHRAEARLYAAASLAGVVPVIASSFEPIRGTRIVPNLAASGTLAQQIREGAEPGVFISASPEWADKLESWGLAEAGTRVDLLANSLVVVVPTGAAWRPSSLAELDAAEMRHLALADPEHVPAGQYAKAALERTGTFDAVKSRVVAAPDVRTALAYVERGEADAGIVFATDAASSERVEVVVRVAPELHARIVYPMLLVKGANRRARELHEFLRGDVARAVFEKAGFTKP